MRWMWIDQIVELDPGKRMVAIKNVSLAEEHLHDHFAADGSLGPLPVYPASLMIEGMAQTSGILVGAARDFKEKVILAKIMRATIDCDVFPGQTIRYEAVVQPRRPDHDRRRRARAQLRLRREPQDHPADRRVSGGSGRRPLTAR